MDEWVRDEQELVRRCREGSEAAYAALVRLHRPRLYTLAYRLLLDREAAEDVVQETFLAAFRQIERFEPRPSLAAWLNTIALRTAARAASRQRARPRSSLDAFIPGPDGATTGAGNSPLALVDSSPASDPLAAAEAADLRREVAAAIAALPFKYRAAVVLRHVMGLEYADAARALDLPLNTYKSHLLRGTRQLREALAGQLEPAGPSAVVSTASASAVVSMASASAAASTGAPRTGGPTAGSTAGTSTASRKGGPTAASRTGGAAEPPPSPGVSPVDPNGRHPAGGAEAGATTARTAQARPTADRPGANDPAAARRTTRG